ncbi:MAG TPA: hypothetical protein VGL13_04175 [Polyangiaceae bacterium]|jgi:hypothetical protein
MQHVRRQKRTPPTFETGRTRGVSHERRANVSHRERAAEGINAEPLDSRKATEVCEMLSGHDANFTRFDTCTATAFRSV